MKSIRRNHLVAVAVGALLISGSNLALAQAGDHQNEKKSHSNNVHGNDRDNGVGKEKVKPIKLKEGSGILKLDTSTVVPQFTFDTSTVTPHIEIGEDHIPRFDTGTATSHWTHSEGSSDQNKSQKKSNDNHDEDQILGTPLGIRKG